MAQEAQSYDQKGHGELIFTLSLIEQQKMKFQLVLSLSL